jgi:hypothetical protein
MPHRCVLALGLILTSANAGEAIAASVLTSEPAWRTYPHVVHTALYGQAVEGAGDVNGDGLGDLVVGAPGSDLGCCQPGAVVVFHGRPTGPSLQASWEAEGPNFLDGYGAGVGSAGDVNGDGFDDLVFSGSGGAANRVLVYHGSAQGLGTTSTWSIQTTASGTYWPLPAVGAGDVNGDGYADLIVGSSGYNGGFTNQGRALVFHGSSSGLSTSPDWTQLGGTANEHLGLSVASAGDVDGDGYAEVLVANATSVRLYRGSASGLAIVPSWSAPFLPYLSAGTGYRESLGEAIGAGDVDGDGYDDVLVGSPGFSSYAGKVELFRGSATGLSTTPVWTVQGVASFALFGGSVDGAGDVNGDGLADVIVGSEMSARGRARLYLGAPAGPSTTEAWSVEGPTPNSNLGWSVRGAGDVNGDGRDDVIVGVPERQASYGQALLFLGEPHATSPAAETPNVSVFLGTEGALSLYDFAPSCAATETDWAIYEGVLGDFTSHLPVVCTTAASRLHTFVPQPGDTYYLVVPRTLDFEGSYGKASTGAERPASGAACLPRSILACP